MEVLRLVGYLVLHNADGTVDEPKKTKFSYEIGDIIRVSNYSNQYKCFDREVTDNGIYYHFKQGATKVTFDY